MFIVGERLDATHGQSLETLNARSRNLDFNFSKSYIFEMKSQFSKSFLIS